MAVQRRRKISTTTKQKVTEANDRLKDLGESRRDIMDAIDRLQADMKECDTEAAGLMKFLKTDEVHVAGAGTHLFKPGRTNAKNTIDPKGFQKAAGANAFWATVNIPAGEAKKHLGEKELSQITTTVPGGETDPKYSFKP